jgi:hypothetical protein
MIPCGLVGAGARPGATATRSCCLFLSRRLDLERKSDDEQRPDAGRALDTDRPAEGLDAIMQADESRALAGIRSADAVVADRQQQDAVARRERNVDP